MNNRKITGVLALLTLPSHPACMHMWITDFHLPHFLQSVPLYCISQVSICMLWHVCMNKRGKKLIVYYVIINLYQSLYFYYFYQVNQRGSTIQNKRKNFFSTFLLSHIMCLYVHLWTDNWLLSCFHGCCCMCNCVWNNGGVSNNWLTDWLHSWCTGCAAGSSISTI